MKNIHIYPSTFANESRIFRTSLAIDKLGVFDSIELVGVLGSDVETNISSKIKIRRFQRDFCSIKLLPNAVKKLLSHLSWLCKVYNFYKNKDVKCINAHSLTVLPLCVLIKYKTKAKLVYDTHELETKTAGSTPLRQFVSGLIEKSLIRYVDYTIVVSSCIKEWYEKRYTLGDIEVIYNCPIPITLAPSDVLRKELDISEESKIFLYQGVLAKGRGVELLIDAFSKLDSRFCLVFMGYGPMESYIRAAASKSKNVYLKEAVEPSQILRYTSSADVGLSIIEPISLSYEYCMPNKLFEYVNAGLPLITSPTREQKMFVDESGVGLAIEKYSSESVRKAVLSMFDNDDKYMDAVNRAREKYNWNQESKKIRAIYKKYLGLKNEQ